MGKSLLEIDKADLALEILAKAKAKGVRILLPSDTRVTREFKEGAETKVTLKYADGGEIEEDWEGIDIGDDTIGRFCEEVATAGTIVWNGPMGVFEISSFAEGTKKVAEAVAESEALTIVGGGDSVTAVKKYDLGERMSFISTGGGASLELLEGKDLPGVAALSNL